MLGSISSASRRRSPLPGRVPGRSHVRLDVAVAAGAVALVALPPLVVTARAEVRTDTDAQVDGVLDLVERVQLGRHAEPGGAWTGRLTANVAGRPALRQTQVSASLLAAGWTGLVTRALLGPDAAGLDASSAGDAFVVPLAAGGALWTSVGADLPAAEAGLAALTQPLPTPC